MFREIFFEYYSLFTVALKNMQFKRDYLCNNFSSYIFKLTNVTYNIHFKILDASVF